MQPSVSVVAINYNNESCLASSLGVLAHMDGVSEIIVVDDASTDRSVEILKSFDVTLIRNEKNLGPVRSRNIGARRAHGKYILFLDSDAAIAPDYISGIADFLERHPEAGAISGKVLGDDGKRMWFNFGNDPAPWPDYIQNIVDALLKKSEGNAALRSIVGFLGRPFTLNFVDDTIQRVDWVVEMALMTRRELFEKSGGFDEHPFMFFEGPDYCRRLRGMGYDVYYFPNAVCRHLGGHSHKATRDRIFKASRAYYLKKYSHER